MNDQLNKEIALMIGQMQIELVALRLQNEGLAQEVERLNAEHKAKTDS